MSEYLRELDTSYTPKKGTFMYIYVISATPPLKSEQIWLTTLLKLYLRH